MMIKILKSKIGQEILQRFYQNAGKEFENGCLAIQ